MRAMVRSADQAAAFEEQGVEAALTSLEGSMEEIADKAQDCDAIVFAAGSGGKTGYDKTLLVDLDGAVKTTQAAAEKALIL
ncbi:hypothetical protein MEZE111188_05230 [Mesobacillus zeae]